MIITIETSCIKQWNNIELIQIFNSNSLLNKKSYKQFIGLFLWFSHFHLVEEIRMFRNDYSSIIPTGTN